MKKLLALFLLASSVFAQQQVQPVAGVLTLNIVPGTTAFKVILSANVTSVVIVNPTPGTIISVIFTENATGGFTVAFGGNIANPCTVTTTANATTTCQFQYDATSNTWNGIGSSTANTANTADGAISPLNFGGDFKVRYESDCTFNSTTTVVCPSGNFTSADAGKIEFGTNALQTHGAGSLIAAPVIVPQGTIVSVTNATTVVVSVIANANCTPSATNLCWFAWGKQDDTAALALAQTAAWNSGPCLTLQMPAGAAFVSKGGLGALGLSQGNSCTGATDFNQAGPELAGMGQGATVLIPLPSFDFTTCTNGANSVACFGGAGALRAHDFQINGLGQTLNATTHANELFEINGVTTFWNAGICTGGSAANLRLAGFGLLSTSLIGFEVTGACDADIVNVTNEDFGNELCNINVSGNVTSNFSSTGLVCFGGNTTSLHVISGGGTFSSTGGYYGSCLGASCNNVLFLSNGTGVFNSSGDLIFSDPSVSNNLIQSTGTGTAIINLWGDSLQERATSGTSQIYFGNATASNLTASQTIFNAAGAGHRIFVTNAGNNITDIGGNTFTAGALANSISGSVFGSYSITGTPVTAAKLVLSAGWGTTAAWTALTGNTQYITGTITASGTGQLANPTITYTFPTPFLVAPTGCFALQVGGAQAAIANPFTPSALTATGVTLTYNGTPVAGNTLFVQVQCWSM